MDLKKQTLKGFRWTSSMTLFTLVMGPISEIAKARYLKVNEMAAVAVFMLVYGLLQTIGNSGIQETIIQKKELSNSEKFTMFMVAIAFGLIGTLIMIILSKYIMLWTGVQHSATLIIAGSPLFFLTQISQFFRALMNRDLFYKGTSIIEMLNKTINILALFLFFSFNLGVFSIICALLLSFIFSSTGLAVLSFRKRNLKFECKIDYNILHYFFSFGIPIALKRIFTYATRRADEFLIAVFLTPETIGAYHLAKESLEKITILIITSYSKMLLPVFSRLKGDKVKLSNLYSRITLLVSYIGIPTLVGICLTSKYFVPTIFGKKWELAIFPFEVLSIAAIPTLLTANLATSLLYSLGRAKIVLVIDIIVNLLYLIPLYIWGKHGLFFILYFYLGYSYIKGITLQFLVNRSLGLNPMNHIRLYIKVIYKVFTMSIGIFFVQQFTGKLSNNSVTIILSILTGISIMSIMLYYFDREIIKQIKSIFAVNG